MSGDLAARVMALHGDGMGSRRIAAALGVGRARVRGILEKIEGVPTATHGGAQPAGVTLADGGAEAVATLPPGVSLGDLDALLTSRGLDPADWHVERVTVNEWEGLAKGGEVVPLRQLKAQLRNLRHELRPAVDVAQRHAPTGYDAGEGLERLVVVVGDHQAPYYDHALHAVFLQWLADVGPDEGVHVGDLLDFPTISRHRDRIRWNATVQECVDAGFRVLSDMRDAAPRTAWTLLRGNHDWRIESEVLDRAERLAFVAPAAGDGEPHEPHLYSIRRLLHLDRLGVALAGVEGEDWRHGEHVLAPGVVVRHEPPSMAKALRLQRTVLAGHTHGQGLKYTTAFDGDRPAVRAVIEVGTMADPRGGLGYADLPDWQQGFATVAFDGDGTHHVDLATWRDGVLTWRGERWRA